MPQFDTIQAETDAGVTSIRLNRPEALNALNRKMRSELTDALKQAQASPDTRVIVLSGVGDRAFSAGMDMKEPAAEPGAAPPGDPMQALEECTCPVIAAVNGYAITGGLELVLGCDVIVAADTASFADTHAKIGALPGWGMSQRLSRLIGLARAKEMHFGCQRIDAQTALDWGLVNRVVPQAELHATALEMAKGFAQHDPAIMAEMKRLADQGYDLPLQDGLGLENAAVSAWKRRKQ